MEDDEGEGEHVIIVYYTIFRPNLLIYTKKEKLLPIMQQRQVTFILGTTKTKPNL